MYIADTLSRATVTDEEISSFINSLEKVNYKDSARVSDRLQEIQRHSLEDESLQELAKVIAGGWP